MTVHIGWVIAAALAGAILGALLMSLMAMGANADRMEEERWEE